VVKTKTAKKKVARKKSKVGGIKGRLRFWHNSLMTVMPQECVEVYTAYTMAYWRTGVLAYWRTGVLVYWCTGVLAYWRTGVMAYWRTGIMA
jgi:hypothetical protein